MGMGGNENSHFPFCSQKKRSSPPVKTITIINSKAAINWQNMSTRKGMGKGGNGNNLWEWEGSGNKTGLENIAQFRNNRVEIVKKRSFCSVSQIITDSIKPHG